MQKFLQLYVVMSGVGGNWVEGNRLSLNYLFKISCSKGYVEYPTNQQNKHSEIFPMGVKNIFNISSIHDNIKCDGVSGLFFVRPDITTLAANWTI